MQSFACRLLATMIGLAVVGSPGPSPLLAQAKNPAADKPGPIERLLQEGWEVAGYVSAWENRSVILFKHKDHHWLVQCSVLIDVTRTPRVVPFCNEIR